MIRSTRFALALCAGAVAGTVVPAAAADALPCAEYISTQIDDEPGTGQLIGTETKTRTITYQIQASPGGVGSTVTVTETTSYEVGVYDLNGEYVRVDCRDYTLARD